MVSRPEIGSDPSIGSNRESGCDIEYKIKKYKQKY